MLATEKFRNQGYGFRNNCKAIHSCNQSYTIGGDLNLDLKSKHEMLGFERCWDTYIAMLDTEKIVANLAASEIKVQRDITLKATHTKLQEYDSLIFGTARHSFLKKWIRVPGTFGWAAVNKKTEDIIGYAIIKQVIRGAGTDIGLAMAPLYADNVEIAKLLF